MNLGNWQLDTVDGGSFSIDGGTVYGVVPKTLWQAVSPSDAQNRVRLRNSCVLARDGQHTILIDTGYGGKHLPLDKKFYEMDDGEPLLKSLAQLGIDRQDVDMVVLSHLHFDHAGGVTRKIVKGRLEPTFPKARHIVGRIEWQDAMSQSAELKSAYSLENFAPLEEAGLVEMVEGDGPIVPGLHARLTGGHTRGHLALIFESAGQAALCIGDLCATSAHLHPMWNLSYDTFPLDTRAVKPRLLAEACEQQWWILWPHDAQWAAGRLASHPKRGFNIVETRERL